jgi:LmbE family N-acetylglucosaminyl deacetylase
MSAFGILNRKLLPSPVTLLTVFTLTKYYVQYGRAGPSLRALGNLLPRPTEALRSIRRNAGRFGTNPWGIARKLIDIEEPYKITRIRLLEDIAFSRRMSIKFRYLNLPDSQARQGRPIMDPAWRLANEARLLGEVQQSVENLILRMGVQAIAAPWPYGGRQHVDHRIVNETAAHASEATGVKLYYLDDRPYSRRPLELAVDAMGRHYSPQLVSLNGQEMKSKFKAMGLYWSQMVPEYWSAVVEPPPGSPEKKCSETVWRPSPHGGAESDWAGEA